MSEVAKLWRVLVGSHAWGLAHEGSDYDYFACYVIDSNDLLSGRNSVGGCHVSSGIGEDGVKWDLQSHELSRWVEGAVSENLNYMIGLFSPLPLEDPYGLLAELRGLVSAQRTTAIIPSTLGMARSNLKKFDSHMDSGDARRAYKNLRSSIRSIWFARRFLEGIPSSKLFDYMAPVRDIPDEKLMENLKLYMELLEEDSERSELPSRPDAEPFHDYEYRIRRAALTPTCFTVARYSPGGE